MNKKINLDVIFNKYRQVSPNLPGMVDIEYFKSVINVMICEGIKQALELAAENAKIYEDLQCDEYGKDFLIAKLDKQSILDTIKQVE